MKSTLSVLFLLVVFLISPLNLFARDPYKVTEKNCKEFLSGDVTFSDFLQEDPVYFRCTIRAAQDYVLCINNNEFPPDICRRFYGYDLETCQIQLGGRMYEFESECLNQFWPVEDSERFEPDSDDDGVPGRTSK